MSGWQKLWETGLPGTVKSPKSGRQTVAEEKLFQRRCNLGTISVSLEVIWGMSDNKVNLMGPSEISAKNGDEGTVLVGSGRVVSRGKGLRRAFTCKTISIVVLGLVVTLVLTVAPVRSASAYELLPTSPLQPTYRDCGRLSSEFYNNHLRPAHERMRACMRQRPVFGQGRSCSGRSTLVAWSQCQGNKDNLCRIQEARDREMKTCQARARAASSERQRRQQDTIDTIKTLERTYKQGRELYKKAHNTYNFVNDPVSYLKKKMNPFPKALNRIFSNQPKHDLSSFDRGLGYHLYRYAHELARKGVSITPNAIVRAIQQEALKHLNAEFARTLARLDQLSMDIANFDVRSSPPPRGTIEQPPGYVPESAACKALGLC